MQAISLDKLLNRLSLSSNRLTGESCGAVRDLLKLNRLGTAHLSPLTS